MAAGALRGNGFGVLSLVQAVGDLGSTLVAGLLWAHVSPTVAFGYATAWMLAALATTAAMRPRPTRQRRSCAATNQC